MSAILELSQIESSASRNGDVIQDNGGAAAFVLDSGSSIGERAACTGLNSRMGKGRGDQATEKNDRREHSENVSKIGNLLLK